MPPLTIRSGPRVVNKPLLTDAQAAEIVASVDGRHTWMDAREVWQRVVTEAEGQASGGGASGGAGGEAPVEVRVTPAHAQFTMHTHTHMRTHTHAHVHARAHAHAQVRVTPAHIKFALEKTVRSIKPAERAEREAAFRRFGQDKSLRGGGATTDGEMHATIGLDLSDDSGESSSAPPSVSAKGKGKAKAKERVTYM